MNLWYGMVYIQRIWRDRREDEERKSIKRNEYENEIKKECIKVKEENGVLI